MPLSLLSLLPSPTPPSSSSVACALLRPLPHPDADDDAAADADDADAAADDAARRRRHSHSCLRTSGKMVGGLHSQSKPTLWRYCRWCWRSLLQTPKPNNCCLAVATPSAVDTKLTLVSQVAAVTAAEFVLGRSMPMSVWSTLVEAKQGAPAVLLAILTVVGVAWAFANLHITSDIIK